MCSPTPASNLQYRASRLSCRIMALNAQNRNKNLTVGTKKCTVNTLQFTIQNSYGFTSAVASVLDGVCALKKWLSFLVFICLQEIGCCRSRWNDPFRIRHGSEELWLSCVSVFEDHNGGDVAAAIAVVRS